MAEAHVQTSAQIKQGDSAATFPMELPRWGGFASLSSTKCWGRLTYLHFSEPSPRRVPYRALVTRTLPANLMAFAPKYDNPQTNRAILMSNRLAVHFERLRTEFAFLASHPRLWLDLDDPGDQHWVLRLPPRTAFYTTNHLFWEMVNLDLHPQLTDTTRNMSAGRNRPPTEMRVFGFFNGSFTETRLFEGSLTPENTPAEALLNLMGPAVRVPAQISMQVEFLPIEDVEVQLADGAMLPTTRDDAFVQLEQLADAAYRAVGLRLNPWQFALGPNGEVVFRHVAGLGWANAQPTLILQLGDELLNVFGLPARSVMTFPLEVNRDYALALKQPEREPLRKKYPATLVASGFGEAKSWILDQGHVAVLGVLWGGVREALAYGQVFQGNKFSLTLQFYDAARNKIVFENDVQVHLAMKFKSLSS